MSTTDLTAARLTRPGPDGARILLLAGRTWLESTGSPDEHRAPVRLLDRLWLSSRRGIEVDVVCGVTRVLKVLGSFGDAWDVRAYDAVVLLPDPGGSPLSGRLQRIVERIARVTRVLGVSDGAICSGPAVAATVGSAVGWDEIRIPIRPGDRPAALVADRVGAALLGVLDRPVGDRLPDAHDAVAERLQQVASLASSALLVGSAAIAVLSGGRTRTLAAVGPALADQACVRAAAVRPLVVLDTFADPGMARDVRPGGGVRFFAAHPLELADGSAMGTLSVFDRAPRNEDEFDPEILRDLALLASAELQYAGAPA